MSNIVSSELSTKALGANAIPTATGHVAPLPNIATQVRPQGPPRTGEIEAPWITSTASSSNNPTAFHSGADSTLAKVVLTVVHKVKKGHIDSPQGNLGLELAYLEKSLTNEFEKNCFADVTMAVTTAYFGAADLASTPANVDTSDFEAVIAACLYGERTALVGTGCLPGISPDLKIGADGIWRYPGVNGGVYEATLTGDATTMIVASPTALAYVCEKPFQFEFIPKGELTVTQIELPRLKIPAWLCKSYDKSSRTWYMSIESFWGVSGAETGALSYAASP